MYVTSPPDWRVSTQLVGRRALKSAGGCTLRVCVRVTRVRIICWVAFLTSFLVMVLTTSTLSLDTVIDGAPCSSLGYVMRKSYISSMVCRSLARSAWQVSKQ